MTILRRSFLAAAAAAPAALAQQQRDWSGQNPIRYTDPDVIALDKSFSKYMIGNAAIKRLWTGARWAEGPAWRKGAGRFLLWSDIPNNRQMRFLEEDGHVSVFRMPSEYSNGNTFDFEGRQVSCQHGLRRVVRYEMDGTTTVIADKWQGKPLNSPNDVVVHPDQRHGRAFPEAPRGVDQSGLAWMPFLMQKLDHEYMLRPSECPLLKKKPSDYMRDMYYSSQPMEIQDMRRDGDARSA